MIAPARHPASGPTASGLSLAASAPQPEKEQLAAAAKQFEAIFVRQMLSEARKSSFGNDLFGSQGLDTFRQMQDERFADIAAERGTFGIAQMIEPQMARTIAPSGEGA